jgi:hypothetical protein
MCEEILQSEFILVESNGSARRVLAQVIKAKATAREMQLGPLDMIALFRHCWTMDLDDACRPSEVLGVSHWAVLPRQSQCR